LFPGAGVPVALLTETPVKAALPFIPTTDPTVALPPDAQIIDGGQTMPMY